MVSSVAWYKSPEECGVYPELRSYFSPRPDCNPLAVLCRERYFVADALFLSFAGGNMQPAFWRKVTGNPFREYGFFQEIAVSKCES